GKFTKVGAANHVVLFSDDGTPQEHGWIRTGQEDATISQPATLYAQFAVFYAKQAVGGVKYHAGTKTDHGSQIVNLLGNLEDAIVAPVVSKANVNDPKLGGNYKNTKEMTFHPNKEEGRPDAPRPPAAEAEAIWKSFARTKALQ